MTTYSWGEFYETAKICSEYGEEEKKKFAVFEALDNAKTLQEIKEIIKPLTEYEINWLNSPCLDGIVYTITDPEKKLLEKEFVETYKYYKERTWAMLDLEDISRKGFTEIAKILVKDATIDKIILSLQTGSLNGHIDIVKMLYQYVPNNEYKYYYLSKCFDEATRNGHNEILEFFLDKVDKITITHALHTACVYGRTDTVKFLLKHGANINAIERLLYCVCYSNYTEIAKILIENKIKLHENGYSETNQCCISGNTEILDMLIQYGANIQHGEFLLSAVINSQYEIVKLLFRHATYQNHILQFSLSRAIRNKNTEIAKFLLGRNATAQESDLKTAILNGDYEIVKLVLESGVRIKNMVELFNDQIRTVEIITQWDTKEKLQQKMKKIIRKRRHRANKKKAKK